MEYIGRQLRLYLTLAQPNACLIQDPSQLSPTGSYVVSNFEFHYSRISFSNAEANVIRAALADNRLIIPFINFNTYTQQVAQGSTSPDITFNPACKNLLGVIAVMQPNSVLNSAYASRKTSTFTKNRLYSARLKLGTNYYPLDILKSISADQVDTVEFIESYIDTAILMMGRENEDQLAFWNFQGQYPDDLVYIPAFTDDVVPTFMIGIQTVDVPVDRWHRMCPSRAWSGADTSRLANCTLELRNLVLQETITVSIFSIEQQFLTFGVGFINWEK